MFAKPILHRNNQSTDTGLRLRPILMNSFAFMLSMVTLMIGSGAGAGMRRVPDTTVFSGMLGITLVSLFLTTVFYVAIGGFVTRDTRMCLVSKTFSSVDKAAKLATFQPDRETRL